MPLNASGINIVRKLILQRTMFVYKALIYSKYFFCFEDYLYHLLNSNWDRNKRKSTHLIFLMLFRNTP